jgi:hypothetical protein
MYGDPSSMSRKHYFMLVLMEVYFCSLGLHLLTLDRRLKVGLHQFSPPLVSWPHLEWEWLRPADKISRVVMSWHMHVSAKGVPSLRYGRRPSHGTNCDKELHFDEIHTLAYTSAVSECGVILDVWELCQRLLVCWISWFEPSSRVEHFRIWILHWIACDCPL